MALAVTNGTATTKASGTTLNVAYPASVAVGDLLLMHFVSVSAVTTPTDWTLQETNNRAGQFAYLFRKIAVSGDVGQSTLAVTTANEASGGTMFRITGHDATTPVGSDNSANGTGTGITVTTITPAKINNLIMMFVSSNTGAGATHSAYALATSSPSFTEHYDTAIGANYDFAAASGLRPEDTATGNATATVSSGAGNGWVAILASISPADESNTVTPSALSLSSVLPAVSLLISQVLSVSALALTATLPSPTPTTQRFPAAANSSKNSASAANVNKNAATATNTAKHNASPTNVNKTQ